MSTVCFSLTAFLTVRLPSHVGTTASPVIRISLFPVFCMRRSALLHAACGMLTSKANSVVSRAASTMRPGSRRRAKVSFFPASPSVRAQR